MDGLPHQLVDVAEAVRADPLPDGINTFDKLERHAHIACASNGAGWVQRGQRRKAHGYGHGPAGTGVHVPFNGFQGLAGLVILNLMAAGAVVETREIQPGVQQRGAGLLRLQFKQPGL